MKDKEKWQKEDLSRYLCKYCEKKIKLLFCFESERTEQFANVFFSDLSLKYLILIAITDIYIIFAYIFTYIYIE